MRCALIGLSLLLAGGSVLAQPQALKSPAPRPATEAAKPGALLPAEPLAPAGPPAAPATRRPSVATGDNDDSADLEVQRRTLKSGPAAAPAPQGQPNAGPKSQGSAQNARSATSSKPARGGGGGEGGPTGQTEGEVYIGARAKARPAKP